MKIKPIVFLLLISINFYAQTEIDSTKIAFVSYWSIGDDYNFKVSKVKERWKEGVQTKNEESNYIANFKVIDSTDSSYTINWSYKNDLKNTYKIPENLLDRFSKYELTEIKYKTSEVGDFIEIINWQEVSKVMSNMFDDIIDVLGEENIKNKNTLEQVMNPLKQIYSSKQGIEQLVLKELQYFHFPMGLEYNITEPLIYDEKLPNMFGGKPIKAKSKLFFEEVDFEESFCVVKQEMNLDQKDTKEMLKQVFKEMKLGDKKIKKVLKTAVFKIEDRNSYEYYYYPGIPHKIETTRETIIDIDKEKGKRIDKIVIELIYNNE